MNLKVAHVAQECATFCPFKTALIWTRKHPEIEIEQLLDVYDWFYASDFPLVKKIFSPLSREKVSSRKFFNDGANNNLS